MIIIIKFVIKSLSVYQKYENFFFVFEKKNVIIGYTGFEVEWYIKNIDWIRM